MSFKTEYKSVTGLGSAKSGTQHFVSQRLTAIALMVLVPMFLYPFMQALGAGHAAVLATYQNPFHALIAIGLLIIGFRHLRLGLQVVIEDYVHGRRMRMNLLITNALLARALAVTGAFAVAKIALIA